MISILVMDKLTKEARSHNMAKIRSKNTKPELLLRKGLFAKGFRYRIHYGIGRVSIDIAFPSKKKAVFVHGCFWHRHENCIEASRPKTNSEMWEQKLERNKERDKSNVNYLKEQGWQVMVVWECELEEMSQKILQRVIRFIKAEKIG